MVNMFLENTIDEPNKKLTLSFLNEDSILSEEDNTYNKSLAVSETEKRRWVKERLNGESNDVKENSFCQKVAYHMALDDAFAKMYLSQRSNFDKWDFREKKSWINDIADNMSYGGERISDSQNVKVNLEKALEDPDRWSPAQLTWLKKQYNKVKLGYAKAKMFKKSYESKLED